MRFQTITYEILTTSLALAVWVPGNLPDGHWSGKEYPNGTTITTSLSDPSLPPIIEHLPPHSIEERASSGTGSGGCWGYGLDHNAVDLANTAFQGEVQKGIRYCSGSSNAWNGITVNNVLVYFCNDRPSQCYNLYPDGVRTGMGLMDAICPAYEAGWALFPNTGSARYIMGKCTVGANICV